MCYCRIVVTVVLKKNKISLIIILFKNVFFIDSLREI